MCASRRFRSAVLVLVALVSATACGDDDAVSDTDAGMADGGMGGTDAGPPPDAGQDAGQDAGPSCTTGCEYVEAELGAEYSCARRANGEVRCWGRGQEGQLGDGLELHGGRCRTAAADSRDCTSRPVTVDLDEPAEALSAGSESACAVDGDGVVRCWGAVRYRIGTLPDPSSRFSPLPYPMLQDSADVAEATFTLCSLETDGSVRCAGNNGSRQTGTGSTEATVLDPTGVIRRVDESTTEPLSGVLELAMSTFSSFACARTADDLHCWGTGQAGQLGRDPATLADECVTVLERNRCSGEALAVGGLGDVTISQVALGGEHACALTSDGSVLCWGSNRAGQLGTDDGTQRFEPAPVPGITTATRITAGANHTCALLSDGSVRCWGYNRQGQLGDGLMSHGPEVSCNLGGTETGDCSSTPVTVVGIDDAVYLDAGYEHTCVIRAGGESIWCWGANDMLQVGGVTTNNPSGADLAPRFAPTAVLGL